MVLMSCLFGTVYNNAKSVDTNDSKLIDYFSQKNSSFIVIFDADEIHLNMDIFNDLNNEIKSKAEAIETFKKNGQQEFKQKLDNFEKLKEGGSKSAIQKEEENLRKDLSTLENKIRAQEGDLEKFAKEAQTKIDKVRNQAISKICERLKTAYKNSTGKDVIFYAVPKQLIQSDDNTLYNIDITNKIISIINEIKIDSNTSKISSNNNKKNKNSRFGRTR